MAKSSRAESPLESAAGSTGSHVTDAFSLLGNDTRLAILLALWEEYDPHGDQNAVRFSRIFERVDYDDPGNLRYHLDKLEGQFVHRRPGGEGYELREPGTKLVRAVIAGAGVGEETMEQTELDQSCLLCGAPTAISYRNGCLFWTCTGCEGTAPDASDVDGFLSATPFDPAGLSNRTPAELRLASMAVARNKNRSMFDGFCPDCSGAVDGWIEYCTDHDQEGICEVCGMRFVARARFQCRACKHHAITSPKALAMFHPAVVSFYDDHGMSIRLRADDPESARRVFGLMHDHDMELRSEDPLRVQVTASVAGDSVCLLFDETASVVEVNRYPRSS